MANFLPLFSIRVEHSFYADGHCRDLDFVPAPLTEALVRKRGLLVRKTPAGISVFYDEENTDPEELFRREEGEPASFRYKVFARDPSFVNFTASGLASGERMLHFDTAKAGKEGEGGARLLHAGETVSPGDLEPLSSSLFEELFTPRDRCRKPNFSVTVGEHLPAPTVEEGLHVLRCPVLLIRFRARETIWKYILIGDAARNGAFVCDRNGEVAFARNDDLLLDFNGTAVVFASEKPLPLQEKSGFHFQLRENGTGSGKIVVKRLPVASARQLGRDTIDGAERAVSEIFVNF